ncbi:MAG: hypothetical protein N2376_06425, partial [Clostridia bacterium]|nr:hypothetical protein [Clostridia bacterium]
MGFFKRLSEQKARYIDYYAAGVHIHRFIAKCEAKSPLVKSPDLQTAFFTPQPWYTRFKAVPTCS